jgi:phosphoribosylaminoimidazole-succinocarboxamide synthase
LRSGNKALTDIDLPLPHLASGKVRELFALEDDLLFVATDRISAFDVVMGEGIPDKGKVLTALTLFWLDLAADICPNHLISADTQAFGVLADHQKKLRGRSMVVRKLEMLPVEFVIRGYLAGSGWKDYESTGMVCGIPLPSGLRNSDRLPEPIFTPTTKAATGHDLPLTENEAADLCGPDVVKKAKDAAIAIYERAAATATKRGIILADTKFEFGLGEGEVVLGDEVLTPDSSRFWPADEWEPGKNPPSYDKQYLRDWLDGEGWDHEPPPPSLPDEVVDQTRSRYVEAFEKLTGRSFTD